MSNTNIIMAAAGATSPFIPGQLNWVYQDGLSQSQTIFGRVQVSQIVYTGSFYCAISLNGKVATSADAITWTYQTGLLTTGFVQSQNIKAHWYAAGGFICLVCDDGRYYTSPDGVTWTQRTSLPLSPFTQIKAFISKSTTLCLFFISGGIGYLYTSTDGINWTNQTSPSNGIRCGVANSSIFCIGGDSGVIFTSSDGITWTQRTQLTTTSWGFAQVSHIVWNGTNFCISHGGNSNIAYSSDGITWTYVAVTFQGGSAGLVAALSGDVRNILVTNTVYKSTTLTTWTSSNSLATNSNWNSNLYGATSGGGIHVIGGDVGQIMVSGYAGSVWSYRDDLSKSGTVYGETSVDAIQSNSNNFVVASTTNFRSATSPTGSTWTYQTNLASTLPGFFPSEISIAWNGTVYCFVGANACATSPDGVNWTFQNMAPGLSEAYAIAWNGSVFCVVGDNNFCATSPDGVTWTYQSGLAASGWGANPDEFAYRLVWSGTKFCLLGDYPYTATSTDGITWTKSTSLYNTSFGPSGLDDTGQAIAYGNGTFVAVGLNGACATSSDGVTWTFRSQLSTFGGEANIFSLIWANGVFCVVGSDNFRCLTSTDGITWVVEPNFPSTPVQINYSIAFNGVNLCVGGSGGFIATTV